MSAIKLLAETPDTVTISRADLERLILAAEDSEDIAAISRQVAEEAAIGGYQASRRNYYTGEEAERLLAGENPVRIWREKRALTQKALAEAAGLQPGYLSEIESGKKPGSAAAHYALAKALEVPMEYLIAGG
jgi:DNA-binding XRE family transcriptional regulator